MGIKIERLKHEDGRDTGMVHIIFAGGVGMTFPATSLAAGIQNPTEDAIYRVRDHLRKKEKKDGKNLTTWEDVLADPDVIEDLKRTKFLTPLDDDKP